MPGDPRSPREILARALAPGKDCPPIERLEVFLDNVDIPRDLALHLDSCLYCRTELDLLRSFHTAPRDAAEEEAVRIVAGRLCTPTLHLSPPAPPWWRRAFQADWLRQRWLTPSLVTAAAMFILVAVGIEWRHSSVPRLYAPDQPEHEILRSGTVKIITPLGDVGNAPSQVQWEKVDAAVQYHVGIFEVDHTELWTASTAQQSIDLPASIKTSIVPSKTLLVQVIAIDHSGRKLAESGFVRFRLLQTIYKH